MRLSLVPDDIIGGLYPLVSAEKYRLQKKKLKDQKRSHGPAQDDNDMADLAMTPPSVKKISNSFQSAAVPQNSPGQPRKGQNGSNTIEDLNKKLTKTKVSGFGTRPNGVVDNNSDDDMQAEGSESTGHKISHKMNKSVQNEEDGDDALLRQLLPKNRRITSGRRTASASGGVRKVSGTSKK